MRFRLLLLLSLLLFASSTFAIDRWILISGTVGVFHTDARIFNPSFDKDITINATFLPAGNNSNTGATPVTFTVPKRQMRVMNDVTTQLFSTNLLGGIKFDSNDEFEVTSRIYAIASNGTLGQFGPGLATASAKAKGAVLQIKANGVAGQVGTFRTNVGVLNPNNASVTVNWRLYDVANAVVGTGTTTLPPLAVIGPSPVDAGLFFQTLNSPRDLSDAWVSYSTAGSENIFVYASVVDNGTTDQTFVPAVDDKGVPPPPPPAAAKEFTVSLQDFSITFSPAPSSIVKGDRVTFHIDADSPHSFRLFGPTGQIIADVGSGLNDRSFTVDVEGLYQYTCNNASCGFGHVQMNGSFTVGKAEPPDTGRGY